jgi:hypothetical protein
VRHYKEESDRKDARIHELEERHEKVLTMYEELLSMKHQREMETLRAQNSERRKDHLLDKLDMLIPIVMSKVIPAAKTPALGEELMRQLLKSLTRGQLSALVGHLSPEQAALIHEIYLAYDREQRRQVREKLDSIRGQLREARSRRKHALREAKERCRAERIAARERARAMRLRVLEDLREAMRAERAGARQACSVRLSEARAIKDEIQRARAELLAEKQYQG